MCEEKFLTLEMRLRFDMIEDIIREEFEIEPILFGAKHIIDYKSFVRKTGIDISASRWSTLLLYHRSGKKLTHTTSIRSMQLIKDGYRDYYGISLSDACKIMDITRKHISKHSFKKYRFNLHQREYACFLKEQENHYYEQIGIYTKIR